MSHSFLENRFGNPILTPPLVQVPPTATGGVSVARVTGSDCQSLSKVSRHMFSGYSSFLEEQPPVSLVGNYLSPIVAALT